MAVPETLQRLKLGQFAGMHRSQMIPLGTRACYFCASSTLSEEELQEYLTEPVSALPPAVSSHLPKLEIFLVPYLERGAEATGRAKAMAPEPVVAENKPDEDRSLASGFMVTENEATLAFAVKDAEVADYHYRFYRTIAELVAGKKGENVPPDYAKLISEELEHNAHGEVDEESWRLKMELTPQDRTATRVSTRFRAYLRRSFIDTLTLYLHGVCCDIDVETGPRQLASHLLRKRLRLFRVLFPPPEGYAVLPEDLQTTTRPVPASKLQIS
jgi:hypothetical protein